MADLKNLGLLGAGAAGAIALTFGAAGIAGAQDDEPVLTDPSTDATVDDAPDATTNDAGIGHHRGDRGERREAMIDRLVEEGVITQEQADDVAAVRDAVQTHREELRAEKQQAIADALGITVDDLEAAREAGTSLADLAGDDLSALVDLFTEKATERIEAAVADGKITQEQADERIAGLDERIQSRIANGGGFGGRDGEGKGHGRRGHGPSNGGSGPAHGSAAEAQEASFT